jgi:hypothetical protein
VIRQDNAAVSEATALERIFSLSSAGEIGSRDAPVMSATNRRKLTY